MLEFAEVCKPSVHVNPIFMAVGADTGMLYSASDATAVVFKYIENENLVKPTNKSIVVLDAILCDALFKGAIKKGKKGHEVLVQGGVIDDLAKHLIEEYGIPKRYLEVLDKTRK